MTEEGKNIGVRIRHTLKIRGINTEAPENCQEPGVWVRDTHGAHPTTEEVNTRTHVGKPATEGCPVWTGGLLNHFCWPLRGGPLPSLTLCHFSWFALSFLSPSRMLQAQSIYNSTIGRGRLGPATAQGVAISIFHFLPGAAFLFCPTPPPRRRMGEIPSPRTLKFLTAAALWVQTL